MERMDVSKVLYEVDEFLDNIRERILFFQNDLEDYDIVNGIRNLDNFIWQLKRDNLYTPELEEFIKYYMKYNND